MTDVTLRIRGDATGVIRASEQASQAVGRLRDEQGRFVRASEQAGAAGRRAGQQIAEGADKAAQAMRSLVASAAAAFGTAQIIAAADAYTRMTGALTLATDSAAELATAQQMLFDIAQANRAPLEATVSLYTKLSGALSEAGATSAELASITSTISQAMAISGTSAAAAEGAIQQLGQAFASGALRGDEFNSVNEAAPRLMQALAASLGVGRGELRALAEQGQLTSDVLARALTGEQARKLAEEFAKLPPTLAQAGTVAQNAFTRLVGEADKATGASAALAQSVIRLSTIVPQAIGAWVDELAKIGPTLQAIGGELEILGTQSGTVAGNIVDSFLVLPTTLSVVFTGIIAASDVMWAGIRAGATLTLSGLQIVWAEIRQAGFNAFAGLALEAARAFDRIVGVVRERAGVLTGVISAINPAAGQAFAAAINSAGELGSAYERVSAQIANTAISISRQRREATQAAQEAIRNGAQTLSIAQANLDAAVAEREELIRKVRTVREVSIAIADSVTLTTRSTAAAKDNAEALRAQAQAAGLVGVGIGAASAGVGAFAGVTASATASQAGLSDASEQAAAEAARYWSGAAGAISGAFGDFVASGLRSFDDFKSSLKRIAQQIISDLVSTFARNRIVIPIMASLGLGPGGGGLMQTLSSFFGGSGTGQAPGFVGPPAPGGGGGLMQGGLSSLMSIFSNPFAAAATVFAGGSAIARALGGNGTIGGLFGGLIGGLSGSSFAPTGRGGTSLNFGESGASGVGFREESRRRSLFRGTRYREVETALGSDVQQQIDALFESIGQAMTAAAAQLGVDVPARITASFRATTDAQGNVISEVGTILGRQYNESFEVFSRRIAAENVIGVLDAALDGEAGRIAEAWRGSADTLADGAQFLLSAATDLRGGFQLLGDASLTGVADLVQRLAGDGESLTTAYARIAGATRLLEEVVSLSGVTFDRTREQFVEFAAGVAEAAGGLEEAQRLFRSYFETFYTEQERGLVQLQQARQRAASLASPLGLDLSSFTGTDGAQAFRELFESQLPTLTAEQTAEWLRFAEALGQVLDLQGRYTDAVIETAETIADFMQGIDAALSEFAPAQALTQQLEAQRAANAALIEQATALGASEEQLARVRALGDARIGAIIGSVSQQTATLTTALRRVGVVFGGTAEQLAVAASGISNDFEALFEEALGSLYSETERAALRQVVAQQNLADALRSAGLSTEDVISRTQLRIQLEAALAAGNIALAESLLRVSRAMDQIDAAVTGVINGAAALINNGNGNQFGGGGGGSGLGFGDPAGGGVGGAGQQLVDTIEQLRRGLREWLQSLTTGDLSPLRPRDQLREARAELARLVQAAQGGDLEALRQLSSAGDTVLRLGQQVFRGADYAALFAEVRALIGGVAGVGSPIGGGGTTRPVDDLGESAGRAAAALDGLADRLGMPAGSLTVPTQQFGGVAAQASPEVTSRPVVQELQRGRAEAAIENARLRAELAELSARMDRMSAAAERSAQELARANDQRRA